MNLCQYLGISWLILELHQNTVSERGSTAEDLTKTQELGPENDDGKCN